MHDDIITEILTRLSVKTLSRFKCVSKSWLSLISSPEFAKSHLNMSANSLRIMATIYSDHPTSCIKDLSVASLVSGLVTEAIDFEHPGECEIMWVVNSCNGLVCFVGECAFLFLWNPCTRIYKQLPVVDYPNLHYGTAVFGVGYNESTDDYNVFGLLGTEYEYELECFNYKFECFIYSCRTNCWRRAGQYEKDCVPYALLCVFFAGKFHFRTNKVDQSGNREQHYSIVSFDLENEVFETIEQPNYGEDVESCSLRFLELQGCFSIFHNKKTCGVLWMMKEYGVKESWSKTVTISYLNLNFGSDMDCWSKPLIMFPSGEILLLIRENHFHFEVYNPKDKTFRVLETSNIGESLTADVYVESLVSPTHGWETRQTSDAIRQ